MSPIKDFNVTYETLNGEGTFSEGDIVPGTVSFTLTKDTKVKSIFVKSKGEAHVHWTEGSGDDETSYSAHRKYFKVKEFLVVENAKGTVLSQGVHHFKFRFKIPEGDMPSSFKGLHGKIVYMLEAKMSRSWHWPTGLQKEINFVSKSFPQIAKVTCPQSGSVNKEMGVFSKGQVTMSATVNRKICSPGDTISIVATICNSSSKTMRPKYNLQQITVYRAGSSTNSSCKSLCKIVGDTIAPNSEETASCQLQIPVDAIYTLYNCDIISVEYYVKVYLDIKFAIDPEIVFPLTIGPSSLTSFQPNEALGPYLAGAAGNPSYSDFPPPVFPVEPYPVHTGPGAYGYPTPYPSQQRDYNNQWPHQAASSAPSSAAITSSSLPVPVAPTQFQQEEEPPSYMSLFPDSHGLVSSSK
ncbi:arrestin domain-containing protein 3-like [Anabas testudineus]|uniref:arrestin domain-containing protein 3-like n=1 Tax=Anabas testudineus TaxID=64144 RepID=UPI000F34B21E|nr:arrestin domain-containing protein 3-like [Anabas testudineus]